jgi:hypothetical protein
VLRSCDVQTAFLNSPLTEDTYVSLPDDVRDKDTVWKLDKALYGLRSAPKLWNEFLTTMLIDDSLCQSLVDPCVFVRDTSVLFVHVGDWIISGEERDVERVCSVLRSKVLPEEQPVMAREGDVNAMLGRKIIRHAGNKFTAQGDATLIDLSLAQLCLSNAKTVSTPGVQEPVDEGHLLSDEDHQQFRLHVGRLMYISADRVDIQFACKSLASRVSSPTIHDMIAVKRTFRYLRCRRNLLYVVECSAHDPRNLRIWGDADWG